MRRLFTRNLSADSGAVCVGDVQNRMSAGMRESSLQGRIYGVFWMAVPNPGASSWRVRPPWRVTPVYRPAARRSSSITRTNSSTGNARLRCAPVPAHKLFHSTPAALRNGEVSRCWSG